MYVILVSSMSRSEIDELLPEERVQELVEVSGKEWWNSASLIPFKPCSSITVSGATQSGKTHFVQKLLENVKGMFCGEPVSQIMYCYGIYQPLFGEMKERIPNFSLHEGLPSREDIDNFTVSGCHTLLVLDDMMDKVSVSSEMRDIFTMGCHHRKLSVIFITQNIFQKAKFARTIALNTHYMVLFRNLRDASQVAHLGRQIFPGKGEILVEAYQHATGMPYGYIIIDMSPHSMDKYRLRTRVFPGEDPIIYTPKNV